MTTSNKRKAKKKEVIKERKGTALPRESLYFSNRKLYNQIQAEEMKLNLKYQKQKHFKAKVKITNISVSKSDKKRVEKEFKHKHPSTKVRQQIAKNYVKGSDEDTPDGSNVGFASVRVITINPYINQKGLKIVFNEADNKLNKNYNLDGLKSKYIGYETKTIPYSEDTKLNDNKIYVEICINGRVSYYSVEN